MNTVDKFSRTRKNKTQDIKKRNSRTPLIPPRFDGRCCLNTNQGRFSDAHAAAEEARDVEPFGKAVRLLCPRLMALHSEDARSQVHPTTRKNIESTTIDWPWGYYYISGRSRKCPQFTFILGTYPPRRPTQKTSTNVLTPTQTHEPLRYSQYTLESLSAVRVQRAWRGHRMVRVLRDVATKQVAALRIQRFMREWRRRNAQLAVRLVVASALELR